MSHNSFYSDPSPLLISSPKLAPRSTLQFKVGPPFSDTIEVSPLFVESSNMKLNPTIHARIDRGFDLEEDKWVGYKRNYFSLVAAFSFEDIKSSISLLSENNFYLTTTEKRHDIKRFALRLVCRSMRDNSEVTLVQHTAKRTDGISPPIIFSIPGSLPSHSVIKQNFNLRNHEKVEKSKHMFATKYNQIKIKDRDSILHGYEKGESYVTVAKYERIQFSSSVGKHRLNERNQVIIQIQLLAELREKDTFAVLAVANTPPLTIRGRPSSSYPNYKQQHVPLQRVHNVANFLNTPRYVPSPLSQGLLRSDEENVIPYSDGFLDTQKALLTFSRRSSSSSESSIGSNPVYNETTFFNTIDNNHFQVGPSCHSLGDELSAQFDSSSFSNDYFSYNEENPDVAVLPHGLSDTCVAPQLVFKD
ncbi:hypothetical protein KGF57_005126 [Candida theae]|uniref:NDT80 domain-containing protein n=1 Tax=Candida theae TaxID=1198502 RepID=A0AAD5B9S4_9ASCO|nr:uncharacterized protein KGF57_005126 [Candida theae]KAI5948933.1 hypothetical protein KGF57_005126 [Candida theae]